MTEPKPERIVAQLDVQERLLLFCIASGTDWTRAEISGATARNLILKELIDHDGKAMRLVLTARGRLRCKCC